MKTQAPAALTNLYRDLRDRRLLPLIGVLLAGLLVVPIALSDKPESAAPKAPLEAVPTKSSVPATQVVLSDPGLRDYRRRLDDGPRDPFAGALALQESEASSVDVPAASGTALGVTDTPSPGGIESLTAEGRAAAAEAQANPSGDAGTTLSPSSGGGTEPQPSSDGSSSDSKVVFYRLKVRTGPVGGEMKIKDEVGPSTQLPSKAVPAVVFLGANFNGDLEAKRAYFMVSNGVSTVSGDGVCSLGDPCQLLSVKPGQHFDLVWVDGQRYRVKLLAFKRHVRDQVPGDFGVDGGSAGRAKAGSRR